MLLVKVNVHFTFSRCYLGITPCTMLQSKASTVSQSLACRFTAGKQARMGMQPAMCGLCFLNHSSVTILHDERSASASYVFLKP